jgi:peptide/nickel transport system permease protein
MVRYTIRRLLISLPTLIAISMVIFAILALAPGDPMGEFAMNPAITAEVRENLRESLGLDEPLIIRYGKWLVAFVQGNMGYSFTSHSPVRELILQRLPTTLQVVGSAYLLSVLLAVPLGIISALRRTTWLDHLVTTLAFVGISLPTFFTGLLFIIIFSVKLGWLPFIYDSTLVVTNWASLVAQLRQALLPVAVLTLFQTAALMRFVRAAMVEQLEQEYVRMARAKGLHERMVITRHMLRNALIPVVTLVALGIPTIFTGAVVTEQVFRVPGIGALLISAIQSNDTPVVMAITFIYAILVVVCNLAADIVYGLLDPRIRYGGNEW